MLSKSLAGLGLCSKSWSSRPLHFGSWSLPTHLCDPPHLNPKARASLGLGFPALPRRDRVRQAPVRELPAPPVARFHRPEQIYNPVEIHLHACWALCSRAPSHCLAQLTESGFVVGVPTIGLALGGRGNKHRRLAPRWDCGTQNKRSFSHSSG